MTHSATRTAAYAAAGIADIAEKVRAGTRLSFDDGMRLFQCPDVVTVGALADEVRQRLHGDVVWYNRNLHVNATNVCEASCIFCSFARLETGDPNAWTMSYEDALRRIRVLDETLVTEVHIVNGLNPDLPYDYYLELMRRIKDHRPDIHVKGITAEELHYYAEKYDMTVAEVLRTMRGAGLDSMPGGGAEIFHPRARRKLCHDKVDADGWLAIHEEAHRQGIFTNCTMLFGSIETTEERVDHLIRLRELRTEASPAGPAIRSMAGPLPDLHPAALPQRQQPPRTPRQPHRLREPAHHRRESTAARQHPACEGLLADARHPRGPGGVVVRRQRPRRNGA